MLVRIAWRDSSVGQIGRISIHILVKTTSANTWTCTHVCLLENSLRDDSI